MKRKILWIMIIAFSFLVVGCQNNLSESEIESILNDASATIIIPLTTTENMTLPESTTFDTYEISISWVSSHDTYLTSKGIVTRPLFSAGNQNVTLTATLTLNDISIQKIYQVTVVALPEEVIDTYEVTFNTNGGSLINKLEGITSGSSIDAPIAPVKDNFTFEGWYKDSQLLTAWNFATDKVTFNVTLYAKWSAVVIDTFTVTFESNGGSLISPLTNIESNALISEPNQPTKDGYVFIGWFKDSNFNNAWIFNADQVIDHITLYAKWEENIEETYTLTFDSKGGSMVSSITNIQGGTTVSEPSNPTKDGYNFISWFTDINLTTEFLFSTPIIENLTLYAKWEEIVLEGSPITTAEQFNTIVTTHNSGGIFYLANDIDFALHSWVYTSFNFKGTINGNGKTISNLTINGGDRSGVFTRVNNATIYNLTLDNINVISTARAGILVGEVDGTNVKIHDIRIMNSSVKGNSSNGVGGLIGYTKNGFIVDVNRIIIEDSTVENTNTGAGALIGRTASGVITIEDINIKNVSVQASNRVGGIYGHLSGTIELSINRAVIDVNLIGGSNLGGVIGLNEVDSITSAKNILLTGSITSSGTNIGHLSGDKNIQTVENIYAVNFQITGTLNKHNLSSEYVYSSMDSINLDWWADHLPEFTLNGVWYYQDQMYHLLGNSYIPKNSIAVTLVLSHGMTNQIIYVKENTVMSEPLSPTHYGFEFIGWYLDQEYTTPYLFTDIIENPISLYAKWEALPTYNVTVDGNTQVIIENGLAIKPLDPIQIGKIFVGWFVGLDPFDFNTPITMDLVIEAKFIDAASYTITFDSMGGSEVASVNFYENQKITQLPKPSKDLYRFSNWYLDQELTILFNQEYLESSITLYAKYVLLGEVIFEEDFNYEVGTNLSNTVWTEVKTGSAVISEANTLKLTEQATEATFEQPLSALADGRYVLVFDFKQGIGGAAFTIEMIHNTTRVFTVGANRANRYTYRNADGSETAVNASLMSVTPNVYHKAIIIFDTEYDIYKYFILINDEIIEVTPTGGVGFASDLDITKIRIRIVGHNNVPSTDPTTYIKNILVESSSETENGKSSFDPEEPIDYEVLVNEIYNQLSIPFANDIRSNIILPSSISNVGITWVSSNPDVVSHTGIVTRDDTDDIHVSLTATISKAGYTQVKEIEVLVKSKLAAVIFEEEDYQLSGFALSHVSIPNLVEGQPGYYVANNEIEFMNAINAENSASQGTTAARIIEVRADLNLGYLEMFNQYGTIRNLESHATPKMHPILKQTGVGKIVIQDRDGSNNKYHEGLVIFSNSGHTIKHAAFTIKRANNIVIRNLKFDELWEWDEATKGDYDSNDWDYFTLDTINGIWFDHIELGKAYDGLIDFKAGSTLDATVKNATFSYMKLVFEPNQFIEAQFNYLEANRSSYNYYNTMRNAGMSKEEIMELNSFQKKGFLLGGSSLRVGNVFTLTIYNSYVKNLQDRFPRLRGGDVHLFNNIYDATDVYEMRNYVREAYPALFAQSQYNRQLTNQALVTTENGAILMENSIIKGVTQVIKSNQVNSDHPTMTGKYKVIDNLYVLGDYTFYGSSEDDGTPFVRSNSEPILPFSWTTITELPYSNYRLVPINILEAYLDSAILGATDEPFDWLSLNG